MIILTCMHNDFYGKYISVEVDILCHVRFYDGIILYYVCWYVYIIVRYYIVLCLLQGVFRDIVDK